MNEPLTSSTSHANYHQMPATPNSIFHTNATNDFSDNSMSMSIMEDDRSNWSVTGSEHGLADQTFQRTPSLSTSGGSNVVSSAYASSSYGEQTRVGYMRCLQIFFFHSSNLLLNRTNLQRDKIKNICCYTLDIYKLFIRKIKMDNQTW